MSISIETRIKSHADFKKKRAAFALLVGCDPDSVECRVFGRFRKHSDNTSQFDCLHGVSIVSIPDSKTFGVDQYGLNIQTFYKFPPNAEGYKP